MANGRSTEFDPGKGWSLANFVPLPTDPPDERLHLPPDDVDSGFYISAKPIRTGAQREGALQYLQRGYMEINDQARLGCEIVPGVRGETPFLRWCWLNTVLDYCLPSGNEANPDEPDSTSLRWAKGNPIDKAMKHLEGLTGINGATNALLVAWFKHIHRLDDAFEERVEEESGNSDAGATAAQEE